MAAPATTERFHRWRKRRFRGRVARSPAGSPRPLFKIGAREETGQEFVWVYRVEAEGPFALQAEEIQGGGWFTPAEIDRWVA